jgi:transcriptional regulator with XRE-family HTH domain
VLLHADGWTYREIARRLGVNKNTVGGLIREEHERRRASREETRAAAISRYESIIRECSRRVKAFEDNAVAQNVTGLLNAKRAAQEERMDRIEGTEAPTRSESKNEVRHNINPESMSTEHLDAFADIVRTNPDVFPEWQGLLD